VFGTIGAQITPDQISSENFWISGGTSGYEDSRLESGAQLRIQGYSAKYGWILRPHGSDPYEI
jgi:hypothetical protein